MYIECRYPGCKAWKKDHDSSNAVKPGLCDYHRNLVLQRTGLPKKRGLTRPFDDYNPRPKRTTLSRKYAEALRAVAG